MGKTIIILSLFILNTSLFSDVNKRSKEIIQEIYIKKLSKINPELVKNTLSAVEDAKKIKTNSKVLYCLVSESVPKSYIKNVILSASALKEAYDIDLVFVLQGFYTKKFMNTFETLREEFDEYQYGKIFQNNMRIVMSPKLFNDFKIKKVPALMYGVYTKGYYPEKEYISYIIRGSASIEEFLQLISQKEEKFEKYREIVSSIH